MYTSPGRSFLSLFFKRIWPASAYTEKENVFVDEEELQKLEQLMHLHYDLNINLEGIDAINNLLAKLDAAQNELMMLKNRLRFFETGQL